MTELNIDLSHLFGSPEIYSLVEWVTKVLALGGLIITERDDELIIQPHCGCAGEQLELPPLPVSPERAAHLFHNALVLREKLELVLADLDHAHRHSRIRKDILVQMIERNRSIGGLKIRDDWYVLRTWRRRGYPRPHPPTDHTLITQKPAKRKAGRNLEQG